LERDFTFRDKENPIRMTSAVVTWSKKENDQKRATPPPSILLWQDYHSND